MSHWEGSEGGGGGGGGRGGEEAMAMGLELERLFIEISKCTL